VNLRTGAGNRGFCTLFAALFSVGTLLALPPAVAIRSGTPTGSFQMGPLPSPGLTSLSVTWSQTVTYSGVSIAALLNITDSNPAGAPGTAYLTTSLGPGAVNFVPPVSFNVPVTQSTPAPVTLFTSLTLPPGTYFLTISNATSNNLGWAFVSGGGTPATGLGVTLNGAGQIDRQDNAAPGPYSPPASPNFVPAFGGGSNFVLLFSVTGNLATGVPFLSTAALLGLAIVLAGSGLILAGGRAANSWIRVAALAALQNRSAGGQQESEHSHSEWR
jgi:hypothetical protein